MRLANGQFLHKTLVAILALVVSCAQSFAVETEKFTAPVPPPETPTSPDSPVSWLGQKLFFDTRFSRDNTISCASCHQADLAFTDGRTLAKGMGGKIGTRNTISLLNATYTLDKFWDGRRDNLLGQVLEPFTNPREHGMASTKELPEKIKSDHEYSKLVKAAFGKSPTQLVPDDFALALSSYIMALKQQNSRFDQYFHKTGNTGLNEPERQGMALFQGRAHCADCHTLDKRAAFTDGQYHARGVGLRRVSPRLAKLVTKVGAMSKEDRDQAISSNADIAALGRFVVTLKPADIGKFRTPSLREVAVTAPYMHDGSLATLEEAVDWELYYRLQAGGPTVELSKMERNSLLAFLKTLTSPNPQSTPFQTTKID